jgi:diadenosine tetraphosphate (Ap4A) HIT family hydrolase
MSDCVFCRILAGELPASFLYRDERVAAFLDINPVNPGHLLIVPTAHAAALADLDPAGGAAMFPVAQRLAAALRASGLRCEGVNLHLADGRPAGQEVMHVHLHVIPRFKGDGFGLRHPLGYGQQPPERAALEAVAVTVREALAGD